MTDSAKAWQRLGREMATELEREGWLWWESQKQSIAELAEDQLRGLVEGCCSGSNTRAQMALLAALPPEQAGEAFNAWQRGTLERLQGIARRRAELLQALGDIGGDVLAIVGRVLQRVLGGVL